MNKCYVYPVWKSVRTGKKFAEKLLLQIIPRIVQQLKEKDLISHWFFIRYLDPKHHLRLRFFLKKPFCRAATDTIIRRYLAGFMAEYLIWLVKYYGTTMAQKMSKS